MSTAEHLAKFPIQFEEWGCGCIGIVGTSEPITFTEGFDAGETHYRFLCISNCCREGSDPELQLGVTTTRGHNYPPKPCTPEANTAYTKQMANLISAGNKFHALKHLLT
jgi:hypothetical protein